MHKIDHSTAVVSRPTALAPGTAGWFKRGDAVNGIAGSVVTADWMNDVQGVLIALLTAAGITPTKGASGDPDVLVAVSKIGRRVAVLSTPGTSTWTVPANVYGAWVDVYPGGGGGDFTTGGGGSGAGGGYAGGWMDVTPGAAIAYTVGAAGAGAGASSPGGNGGSSSFGPSGGRTFQATGGAGSAGGGALGGSGSGGDINLDGQVGCDNITITGTTTYTSGGDCAGPHGGKGGQVYLASPQGVGRWPGGGGGATSGAGGDYGWAGAAGGIIIFY